MRRVRLAAVGAGLALAIGSGVALSRANDAAQGEGLDARVENLSGSIVFFERQVDADTENYLAAHHLIDRYLLRFQLTANLADVQRAEEAALALLNITPQRADALARLSSVHLTQHEFAAAITAAEAAVAADTTNETAMAALFSAAMAAGRYDQAETALHALSTESVPGRIRLAQWLSATGESDGAHHHLRRACNALEQAAAVRQTIAWCLTELGGLQFEREGERSGRALYERALRIQPGYRGAMEGLADLAHARGDWVEAERLYLEVAADAHPDIYLRLAEVSRAREEEARAAEYDRRFLRIAVASGAEALYAQPLAMFYAQSPQTLDVALEVAERDVARRPTTESYDVLAWVHFRRGEFQDALDASDRARQWGAPSPTMDFHRALILVGLGREAEAAPLEEQALQRSELLDPHLRLREPNLAASAIARVGRKP